MAGTPWHGSGRFAEAAEVPLGGIYLLQQAAEDRSMPISASQARLALLDVAAVPWFEDSWEQRTLDGLDRLVGDVEIRRFHFTKTPSAVRAWPPCCTKNTGCLGPRRSIPASRSFSPSGRRRAIFRS